MDIFDIINKENKQKNYPLAERLKPKKLDDFVGQETVLGEDSLLRTMILKDKISSIILHGPAGSGKTSIAEIIANETKANFLRINAVNSGIDEIKKTIEQARENLSYDKKTIVFIDEIHRFNKKQQDALLPFVENGTITLIGATTENPYFEVNSALISRVIVIRLERLGFESIYKILKNAIIIDKEASEAFNSITEDAAKVIYRYSGGDARKALNVLQGAIIFSEGKELNIDLVSKILSSNSLSYDKNGDNHYDVISAFIKSIRGSDPQAAIHYLARMLESGEDPMFIARRLVILASEDIGNADPMALLIANAAKDAVYFVGMPEARIPLSQATCYLASTLKSNRSYLAINSAIKDIRTLNIGTVPMHLKDSSYKGAEDLDENSKYKYPHDYNGAYVEQEYMPKSLKNHVYYKPSNRGTEKRLKEYLDTVNNKSKK